MTSAIHLHNANTADMPRDDGPICDVAFCNCPAAPETHAHDELGNVDTAGHFYTQADLDAQYAAEARDYAHFVASGQA